MQLVVLCACSAVSHRWLVEGSFYGVQSFISPGITSRVATRNPGLAIPCCICVVESTWDVMTFAYKPSSCLEDKKNKLRTAMKRKKEKKEEERYPYRNHFIVILFGWATSRGTAWHQGASYGFYPLPGTWAFELISASNVCYSLQTSLSRTHGNNAESGKVLTPS